MPAGTMAETTWRLSQWLRSRKDSGRALSTMQGSSVAWINSAHSLLLPRSLNSEKSPVSPARSQNCAAVMIRHLLHVKSLRQSRSRLSWPHSTFIQAGEMNLLSPSAGDDSEYEIAWSWTQGCQLCSRNTTHYQVLPLELAQESSRKRKRRPSGGDCTPAWSSGGAIGDTSAGESEKRREVVLPNSGRNTVTDGKSSEVAARTAAK